MSAPDPDAPERGEHDPPERPDAPAPIAPEPDEAPARREPRTRAARKPRKARGAARADTRPARAPREREAKSVSTTILAKGLEQTIQGVAIAVTILDAEDGAIISRGEPRLTAALIATAEQNPRFKKRLEEMLEGGTYMQLAVAVGAIVLPITMRHVPMPAAFRHAAVMAQAAGEQAPDAPPPGWGEGAPIVHEPGVIYQDVHGPYTIDDAGNVVPVGSDEHGAAQ